MKGNDGGAIVSDNKVGDSLSLAKVVGGPVEFSACDPLNQGCVEAEPALEGTMIVVGNTVGDNVAVLEPVGDVTFSANLVEGSASVDKTKGEVTANDNSLGYEPLVPEPEPEPAVPGLPVSGSLLVSEASAGASGRDNTTTNNLDVTENLVATTVSNNHAGVTITVAVGVEEDSLGIAVGRVAGEPVVARDANYLAYRRDETIGARTSCAGRRRGVREAA